MNVETSAAQSPPKGALSPITLTEIHRTAVLTPTPTKPTRKNRTGRWFMRAEMAMRRCVAEATASLRVRVPRGQFLSAGSTQFPLDKSEVLDDRAAGHELAFPPLEIVP